MYSVLEKCPSSFPVTPDSWAVANVIGESHVSTKPFAGAGTDMHHNSVNRLSFHTSAS